MHTGSIDRTISGLAVFFTFCPSFLLCKFYKVPQCSCATRDNVHLSCAHLRTFIPRTSYIQEFESLVQPSAQHHLRQARSSICPRKDCEHKSQHASQLGSTSCKLHLSVWKELRLEFTIQQRTNWLNSKW